MSGPERKGTAVDAANGEPGRSLLTDEAPEKGLLDKRGTAGRFKEETAWDIYNSEAKKVDEELVKDWIASLNSLLVFAAIFAAVLTAFIIESKKLLERDQTEAMVDIMIFYVNNRANGSISYDQTEFQPPTSAVLINSFLFGSLSASLVAAVASVVALQWVAEFDAASARGGSSPKDRANRRHFRFAGVKRWGMGGIIALLPQLMYFSVGLFFAGMVQWMLLLHSIVAYLFLGGAIVGALFYILSTLISVVSASAPFKTPLTRLIYSSFQLLFRAIPGVITTQSVDDDSHWILRLRQKYKDAYKRRESTVVQSSIDSIKYHALNWLASQIGTSEGTRRNLAFLLEELLRWPEVASKSREFWEEPWNSIMNFLAQKQWNSLHLSNQKPEDEHELAILLNCTNVENVQKLIIPKKFYDYHVNPEHREYWSQHCVTSTGSPSVFVEPSKGRIAPPALLLLTRDLPVPNMNSSIERQATLRLAKWRNSEKKSFDIKSSDIWERVFTSADTFSSKYFNSCVFMLCNYARSIKHHPTSAKKDALMASLVEWSAKNIPSIAVTALVRVFEHLLERTTADYFSQDGPCVLHPWFYSNQLRWGDEKVRRTHRALTLALAKDLQSCTESVKARRLADVLGMLWFTPSSPHSRSTRVPKRSWNGLDKNDRDGCTLQSLHGEIFHDWALYVDNSEECTEVLCLLIKATSGSEAELRWLDPDGTQSRDELFSLLCLFDDLLSKDQQFVASSTIIKSLCTIMQKEFTGRAQRDATLGANPSMSIIKSPFIRTIAYRALEVDIVTEEMPKYPLLGRSSLMDATVAYMFWNMSEEDPETLWQLRARLIFDRSGCRSSDSVAGALRKAFTSPIDFMHFELVFAKSTSCYHKIGPGHLLCHLEAAASHKITLRTETILFDSLSLDKRSFPPITALLTIKNSDELSSLELTKQSNAECIKQLWNRLQFIRKRQSSALSLLLHLPIYQQGKLGANPAYAAILLDAIEKSLMLPPEEESNSIFSPLSRRISSITKAAEKTFESMGIWTGNQERAEVKAVIEHGRRIRELVLSHWAVNQITNAVTS